MNGPLNSLPNAGKNGTSNTAATDWAAKLSSSNQAGKSDAATMQSEFSRWMANATSTNTQASSNATQQAANAKASAGQGASSTSVEARNAMARAQANAAQAKRQAPVTKADAQHAPKTEKPKAPSAEANKSANKTDVAKGNKASDGADKADRQDAAAQDEVSADAGKLDAAKGEVEAKDPHAAEGGKATDPSSMLAWLANLTQGGPTARKALGGDAQQASADAQAQFEGKEGPAPAATTGHDALAAIASSQDKGAIDVSTLQAAEGRLAVLEGAGDASAKGADFASTLSTEMMRGMAAKTAEASATAQTSATLASHVNSPEFPQALADRVGMWVNATGEDGTMSAELHLNPAEMGPISVKISLDGQSAQVDFAAANLETRRAIEASLPMLSASLDEAGFSLGGSGVSDQTPQQQFNNNQAGQPGGAPAWGGGTSGQASSGGEALDGRAAAAAQAGRRGGLDLYA